MRLAIDAGNTRIKWAFGQAEAQAVEYRGRDLRALLRRSWLGQPRPEAVHVASVANRAVADAIRAAVQDCWPGTPLTFLVSRVECCGVRVAYAQPECFGVDRLAALVAAHARSEGAPVVVVDVGTAVTVDALDAQGRHLGGMIMPGLRLLQACLLRGTAGVADAWRGSSPLSFAGGEGLQASTKAGVIIGAQCMFAGGTLRAIDVAMEVAGANASLYLTGGDAAILARALGREYVLRPDLVLEGIALMAQGG